MYKISAFPEADAEPHSDMLFNSYTFVFVFLPVTLLGYVCASRFGRRGVVSWLSLASLAFYAYWRPAYLALLCASIVLNFIYSRMIYGYSGQPRVQKTVLWVGIASNLLLLGYYKYLFPLLSFLGSLGGRHHQWADVVLPLGISFFTFTQIGYLVDLNQDAAERQDFLGYVLFVAFFPHLIAGPLLHHKEMMPQINEKRRFQLSMEDLALGFSWFLMGLFKKVVIADTLAKHADVAFANSHSLSFLAAWGGVLAYALQLYFDFSGYSDMALGLARMFSIRLPLNFNSPYKATSITEYWQRWHMTLTRYATLYLYNPVSLWVVRLRVASGKAVRARLLPRWAAF